MDLIDGFALWTAGITAVIAAAGLAFAYYKFVLQRWERRFDAIECRFDAIERRMDRDRQEALDRRAEDRAEAARQRAEDRAEQARQRAEDRAELRAGLEHANAQHRDTNAQLRDLNRRTGVLEGALLPLRPPSEGPERVAAQQVPESGRDEREAGPREPPGSG